MSEPISNRGPASHVGLTTDDTTASRAKEIKAHLENDLRTRRNALIEHERHLHELEQGIRHIDAETARLGVEIKRVEGEISNTQVTVEREKRDTQGAEHEMHELDQEVQHKEGEIRVAEKEIAQLKRQIEEKERGIRDTKEELHTLAKGKEDLRRKSELEYFDVQSKGGHIHDKELSSARLKREITVLEASRDRKRAEEARFKQGKLRIEEEIRDIESKLSHG